MLFVTPVYALAFLLVTTPTNALLVPGFGSFFNFNWLLPVKPNQIVFKEEEPSFEEYKSNLITNKFNKVVPDHYIVILKDELSEAQIAQHKNWLEQEYSAMMANSMKSCSHPQILKTLDFFQIDKFAIGYMGYFTEGMIGEIMQNPNVMFVEQDSIFKVNEFDVQKDAPWGLSRISHRENSNDKKYLFDNDGGKGVTAYVIDTGIKVEHQEFEGRASWGDAIAFPKIRIDGHGHGTHCAGIIGSKTYGIAKHVELVAVGVMNLLGSGTTSDIIKGVEFVVNKHQQDVKSKKPGFKGSVVNMSIGGGISEALDLAVNAAVRAGLHVSVAAGNDNADACDYSPGRANGPITVGASNIGDAKASFSNWGKCVDLFAPGEAIESTFIWSDSAEMSGTSMASPHIAGLLAYYLSLQPEPSSEFFELVDPATLKKRLLKYGTRDLLTGLNRLTPNVLAYNGAGGNLTDFWNI
ncbi:SUB8 [Candida oxycetoniae]|uniref:SUB8 n=1 Tax=Candida oxycetoniae TaxID=497107 RepID=A0AAI9SWS1_9ASCO|nr:SUB8 [Candida oxycetoniae]KAI3404524.1 SUB8 [Candida oxycetoniae]